MIKFLMDFKNLLKTLLARKLRKNQTKTEEIVWKLLRNNKFQNIKFRRQFVMDGFIFDFYCMKYKLAIEVDGSIHELQKDYDKAREIFFREKGINFIRFTNEEIINNPKIVYKKLNIYFNS